MNEKRKISIGINKDDLVKCEHCGCEYFRVVFKVFKKKIEIGKPAIYGHINDPFYVCHKCGDVINAK